MIAFYEDPYYYHSNPKHDKWKKWCETNGKKREKLMTRLNLAILNRDKALESDLRKQIKKIDNLRFE
jgi:hypothetical protein